MPLVFVMIVLPTIVVMAIIVWTLQYLGVGERYLLIPALLSLVISVPLTASLEDTKIGVFWKSLVDRLD